MSKDLTFDSDCLEYTHTGFMQTLRDRKSGMYDPDTTRNAVTKIDSLFKDLILDLKDILGYSASSIVDAAIKNGIRRIEYYHPDDNDMELYKLAKKVNIVLSNTYKDRSVVGSGNAGALYIHRLARANLSVASTDFSGYMQLKIDLSGERSSIRYINDDIVSGYYSYFRNIKITKSSMINAAFMSGVSADMENESDWSKVDSMIPLQYNNAVMMFTDSAYNAYTNLMNDEIFKQCDEKFVDM